MNIKAAELMGRLHDRLEETGYTGHALELYLVRLLFCLFADDTGIFEKGTFWQYLDLHTKPDGSDLAMHLATIFHTLNTPKEQRLKNLDENLAQFPYVNGKLFEENLPPAAFDSKMREMLLETCGLDWGNVSPAIFGSMFQAVMNPRERRNLGAHYTSEKNIQKVIKPLLPAICPYWPSPSPARIWPEPCSRRSGNGHEQSFHRRNAEDTETHAGKTTRSWPSSAFLSILCAPAAK